MQFKEKIKTNKGRISVFRFPVTVPSFRLLSELLFFPEAALGICNPAFGLVFNLSKKVTKPCLPARQERTPPPITPPNLGRDGGFPDLTSVLL
jgi:hypothetical protein